MNALILNNLLHTAERGILLLLVVLGIACVSVFARRWRAVGRAAEGATRWRGRLEKDLSEEVERFHLPGKIAAGEAGMADRLMRAALNNTHLCPEALEKVLETQESREREMLERGAHYLGTVGANAPFLGLTGTVLGILGAFRQMADAGGGGVEVMAAISGALIATAAGLFVAIPAVVLYNLLKARIRKTLNALREMRGLMIARSLQAVAKEAY
ncbi:MAG: MotA/TolQ/ExbB proton channel family protein [Fibrobacteria bacterium]|jgi:biopolymer transport protein ExbB|nr:MotA/TolQ/ExbB proton channel family protein [Fibrobacteria bacterium]